MPPDSKRGFITQIWSSPTYLEMAVDLALSLREHTSLPIALAADAKLARVARRDFPGVFQAVTVVPERFGPGLASNFGVVEACPFERAIYLDADCLVVGSPDTYWEPLAGRPLAMVGEMLPPDDDQPHHGFRVSELVEMFGLDGYLKSNSGVFYFEREGARPLMEECLACHRDEILPALEGKGGFLGNELAFAVVGARRNVARFPFPGPMFWPAELAELDLDAPSKPVLHLIGPVKPRAWRRLLDDVDRRRREAGLPAESARCWEWKLRHVEEVAGRAGFVRRAWAALRRMALR
jgi:hypothetical protein